MNIEDYIKFENSENFKIPLVKFKNYSIHFPFEYSDNIILECYEKEEEVKLIEYGDNSLLIDTLNIGKQLAELETLKIINKIKKNIEDSREVYDITNNQYIESENKPNFITNKRRELADLENIELKQYYKKVFSNTQKNEEIAKQYNEITSFLHDLFGEKDINRIKMGYDFISNILNWVKKNGLPYNSATEQYYQVSHNYEYTLLPFLEEASKLYTCFLDFEDDKQIEFSIPCNSFLTFQNKKKYELVPSISSTMDFVWFQFGILISDKKNLHVCKKCHRFFCGNAKRKTCSDACRQALHRMERGAKNGNN